LVCSIPTIPFGDKFNVSRKINDHLLIKGIKNLMKKYNIDKPVLLFYKPRYSCVINKIGESLVCYDVIDDTLALEASPNWLEDRIKFLKSNSDLIITSSENLYRKISEKRKDVFFIGNGVETEHYTKSDIPSLIPDEIKNEHKIIGYIGAIGEWFDFDLLEKILKRFPNFSIVLIGWVFRNQKRTLNNLSKQYKNLHILGLKPYQDLPKYVKDFDVCIIPFRIYELTNSVNPTKVYEYLASGKPVITTSLPELKKFDDVLYIAKDHEEFLINIDNALVKEYDIEKAIRLAQENDWEIKVSEMLKKIQDYAAKKSSRFSI
jgi:glycosyltransferase involved in cell wall biosynthesis